MSITAKDLTRMAKAVQDRGAIDLAHRVLQMAGQVMRYAVAHGHAAFDKSLASHIVFSEHSLVTDGVFAEVQLVSCRNVLIYFDRELQDRVLGVFGNALCRKGFLGLGAKESLRLSAHASAFDELVRADRIFQKAGEWPLPRGRRT